MCLRLCVCVCILILLISMYYYTGALRRCDRWACGWLPDVLDGARNGFTHDFRGDVKWRTWGIGRRCASRRVLLFLTGTAPWNLGTFFFVSKNESTNILFYFITNIYIYIIFQVVALRDFFLFFVSFSCGDEIILSPPFPRLSFTLSVLRIVEASWKSTYRSC